MTHSEICSNTKTKKARQGSVAGRGSPSRAWEWALVYHLEMYCLRRHMCWTKEETVGKGCLGGEHQGKGTEDNCSATWLTVLGFMVMALVSRLFLANHSDSGSFLVAHTLLSQDGRQREGFWEVLGHMASPFDPSWTLREGGGLLVPCSLPRPPVVK